MKKYCVIVATSSTVKIYTTSLTKSSILTPIYEKENPQSRLKNQDFMADRPGHIQSDAPLRAAFVPHTQPKLVEENKFANKIAHFLNLELTKGTYQDLILIASPHFKGLLKKHFTKAINASITHDIDKDYSQLKEDELLSIIKSKFAPLLS